MRKIILNNKQEQKTIGIYIHIPFCDKVCNYCDFTVFQGAKSKYEEYVNILKKEIELRKNKNYIVDTIFIGGGTPSIIEEKFIFEILLEIRNSFTVLENIEITIETNPKTLSYEKLKTYEDCGINRISLGVQSFNDEILKKLGRNHNSNDALETIELIKQFNFSLNLDFIFGYQEQSLDDIFYDLSMIEKISPDHISYYSLIIEEGTKFGALEKLGKLKYMYDEDERKMYHTIVEKLNLIGLKQYEISNFSKENKQSIHNKKYWQCKEYLSFGVGAHSYLDNIRFANTKNFSKYLKEIKIKNFAVDFSEELDTKTRKFEFIIMNMRLIDGFSLEKYKNIFETNFLEEYKEQVENALNDNIIEISNGNLKFTKKGLDITDNFFVKLLD